MSVNASMADPRLEGRALKRVVEPRPKKSDGVLERARSFELGFID